MRRFLVAAAAAALVLTGCSSGEDGPESNEGSGGSAAATEGTPGENLPTVEDEPIIEGAEITMPVFDFSGAQIPEELTYAVVSAGDGPEVEAGDTMVADYVGTVWGADEPFDSSFMRGQPAVFDIDNLVPGWRDGVVGLNAGDRVILSIPSELGYGPNGGNQQAGIAEDDTIVFVIDIFDTRRSADDFVSEPNEVTGEGPDAVSISAEPGTPAIPVMDDGADEPEEMSVTVISEGTGDELEVGDFAVMGYAASTWNNEPFGTSWSGVTWDGVEDPYGQVPPLTARLGVGTPFDELVGVPVGSRVLFVFPGDEELEQPSQVFVLDVAYSQN